MSNQFSPNYNVLTYICLQETDKKSDMKKKLKDFWNTSTSCLKEEKPALIC